jgi:hypothetical protein
MSTFDRYAMPSDLDWEIPRGFETGFGWEYDDGRAGLVNLYRKAKELQWDSEERIDWSQDLDPENPSGLPDVSIPIFGSPSWEKATSAERAKIRHHYQVWQLSQFLHGEQGALICTAKIVQQVPDMDAKFCAATQVVDEARHVAFGRLALRDYYPQLTQAERDEFVIEACYLMRDRFLADEVWGNLGLPTEECRAFVDRSEMMEGYRSDLFTRIVPTIKDIGLWGPKIQDAYGKMGILGYADVDVEALQKHDEQVAEVFDSGRPGRAASARPRIARCPQGAPRRAARAGHAACRRP